MFDSLRTLLPHIHGAETLVCSFLAAASLLFGEMKPGEVKIQVRDGRPIVDGVYVNGHGPYRFVLDTGTSVNLIQSSLAGEIRMKPTFRINLASALSDAIVPGSDENVVELGPVSANEQRFLLTDLAAVRKLWPDIRGVVGQWFLSRFDYLLDLHGESLKFGKLNPSGKRTPFTLQNGRTMISTSLGELVLDSGIARLVLFGIKPRSMGDDYLQTVTGMQQVGMVSKSLVMEGKSLWRGDAVAIPGQSEPGVAGLMPLGLFRTIYICNSEGYLVFE